MLLLINNKTNSQIHLINKGLYRDMSVQKSVQKSVHSRYIIRGIIGEAINKKAAKYLFYGSKSGADETRTRDLLRDRQAF